jgi:hypothetical protein
MAAAIELQELYQSTKVSSFCGLKTKPSKVFTAITAQTNHKKKPESTAKQRFQVFSWFGFERNV